MKPKDNKDKRISIRLTDNEMNLLETNVSLCGLNKSAFLRHVLLKFKPPIHKFDRTMVNQLSRLGNNLNQIAKHVNISRTIDRMVLKQILDVNKKLDNLIDKK